MVECSLLNIISSTTTVQRFFLRTMAWKTPTCMTRGRSTSTDMFLTTASQYTACRTPGSLPTTEWTSGTRHTMAPSKEAWSNTPGRTRLAWDTWGRTVTRHLSSTRVVNYRQPSVMASFLVLRVPQTSWIPRSITTITINTII